MSADQQRRRGGRALKLVIVVVLLCVVGWFGVRFAWAYHKCPGALVDDRCVTYASCITFYLDFPDDFPLYRIKRPPPQMSDEIPDIFKKKKK